MALTEILFGVQTAKIGSIEIDADIETVHDASWEITEWPVETGADIADHRRRKLRTVKITGVITNTPVRLFGGAVGFSFDSGFSLHNPLSNKSRATDAWKQLNELANTGDPITVVTSLETLANMVITDLQATRTAQTANVLSFVATLREIQFASSEIVAPVSPTKPKAKPKPLGKKAPKIVPPAKAESVLHGGFFTGAVDAVKSFFGLK